MQSIFNSQNLIIFLTLVVGMIIGASLDAYKKDPVPPPKEDEVDVVDDAVNVVVLGTPILIPDGFKAVLRGLGTTGIALVDLVDDKPTLRAVTIDGVPIDLCGPGIGAKYSDRTCRLRISTSRLMARLAGTATCPALCTGQDLEYQYECHTTGTRKNKYPCHGGGHTKCYSTCQ